MTENPYLSGNHAPVPEEVTATDLPVTGALPSELSGRYLRNGPNPVSPPEPSTYHWFTGSGMVHGIRIRDRRAEWYRNRWVRSKDVAEALGEPAPDRLVHGGMDFAPNTNVIGHAGRTLAIVEAGALPYELTYELETVGPTDFDGTLGGGYTAHPKRDPESGELHAVSYFWGWGNAVRYSIVGVDGRVRRALDIECGGPVSIHDLSITERYAVIYDLPVVFTPQLLAEGFAFPYGWDAEYQARIGLVDRLLDREDVQWFDIDPCYVFHPLNAYDDDDRVVLDVVRHEQMFVTEKVGPGGGHPCLERWTVEPATGVVKQERLDDRPQEFPRVDERLVGRRHRFGYTSAADLGGRTAAVVKHDLDHQASDVRPLGPGTGPAEPVFVPREETAGEDDGWVLCLAYDAERDATDLLVLNAGDLTGEPQAVVHLPARVPVGFHGNWVPDEA
jgi:carotenoid cleavage dioxygenase